MGLSVLLCAMGEHNQVTPELLVNTRCSKIHLREEAQPGTEPGSPLLLAPAWEPGGLQAPGSRLI